MGISNIRQDVYRKWAAEAAHLYSPHTGPPLPSFCPEGKMTPPSSPKHSRRASLIAPPARCFGRSSTRCIPHCGRSHRCPFGFAKRWRQGFPLSFRPRERQRPSGEISYICKLVKRSLRSLRSVGMTRGGERLGRDDKKGGKGGSVD